MKIHSALVVNCCITLIRHSHCVVNNRQLLSLASNEKVSNIKNFLPGDPVGVARMSETLWDVEETGWASSAASRLRKLASKCDFQEWPRKIHKIVQNICKFSLNCQEAALNWRVSTALAQARQVHKHSQFKVLGKCLTKSTALVVVGLEFFFALRGLKQSETEFVVAATS